MSEDNNSIVYDFDIVKPKSCNVKIDGFLYDLSYIPVGITFDIEAVIKGMRDLDAPKLLDADNIEIKKGLNLSIKLVFTLLNYWNPEITEEYIIKKFTPGMIETLVHIIKQSLSTSMEGIKQYGKN